MSTLLPREIYRDEDLIILDKPSGISVIPDRSDDELPSIRDRLIEKEGRIWIVHRLDKATSGLLVVARHAEAHRHLNRMFEEREVNKEYLAIVDGHPEEDPAEIAVPLLSHPHKNLVTVDPSGKPSATLIKTERAFGRTSLLRVRLLTGRKHQIRVHLAYLGNPLLVDPVYGRRNAFFLSEVKKKYKPSGEERPLIQRLTLHAASLSFIHPFKEVHMEWELPLPRDLQVTLKQLDKWDN